MSNPLPARAGPPKPTAPGPVRVRLASADDASQWNTFVAGCSESNFYQRFEWQAINQQQLRHQTTYLLAERQERIVGLLPLVQLKSRLFGHIISSMPFVNFGGPAATDPQAEADLLDAARRHAEDSGCDYLEIRAARPLGQLPAVSNKVSMTVPLRDDPDALMDEFSRKHRKNIRSTYSHGIVVRSGGAELLETFYDLMRLSWRALGTPLYRKAYFAAIIDAFGEDVRIYVAYHEGRPIATALNGFSTDTVEGMWAAMDPAQRRWQPNYALYWEMIKDACERRYRQFHLGRSTVGSGAAQFKAKWRAEPKPLYWNYHLVRARAIPALNPDNPRYALAIRAWRMLPLFATDILGPRLARLIP